MTKKKILTVSSKLFFQNGIANVRLQQIADEADISVGNLAYHYKNKEAIVSSIYEEAFVEMYKLLDGIVPRQDLTDFDNSIKAIYKFHSQYNFCFNNVWEIFRNYPHLQQQWQVINNSLLSLLFKHLGIYVRQGILKPEPHKGAYKILSHHLLLNLLSWISYQHLSGKPASLQSFKKSTWNLIIPHFSDRGITDFNNLGLAV
jgi:AcrR family transcriptional regulator